MTPEARKYLRKHLEFPMPRGRESLFYRKSPEFLDRCSVGGKKHLIFIGYYPHTALIKKAFVLKQTGRYFITFLGCCIREDCRVSLYFDQVFEIEHYRQLYEMLPSMNPWAFHVSCIPLPLALMVFSRCPSHRKILDVNDSLYFSEPGFRGPAVDMERDLCREASFICHKMPEAVFDEMCRVQGISSPRSAIHSFPVPLFFRDGPKSLSGKPRIVLAGGVMPKHLAQRRGMENHIIDPMIDALTGTGLPFTFFINQNARNMFWEEHQNFVEMAEKNSAFSFRKGVPYHELSGQLQEFDFGMIYERMDARKLDLRHITHNMATKLFSYLEAGIPVLIHDRSLYMASIVKRHGIGIVYPHDRLEMIPRLIRKSDAYELKKNVKKYRENNSIGSILPLLEEVYETPEPHMRKLWSTS